VPGGIVVANRTVPAAVALAAKDPSRVTAIGLDGLAAVVAAADLVISAVEADSIVLPAAALARAGGPVLVVDLGMPRTVDPVSASLPGVTLLDIAHLRDVVDVALKERRDEIAAAEVILSEEVERFLGDRRARGAAPLVTELRTRLEQLRVAEFDRNRGELATLSAEQLERVEQLTRSLVAKIAHEPTVALRESSGTDRGHRLADAVRALFGL
jgi:glutamyl-tRNA reductase